MSSHTDVVEAYMEGFRRSDKPAILELLTDDVAWTFPDSVTSPGRPTSRARSSIRSSRRIPSWRSTARWRRATPWSASATVVGR